jgi:SAM-dependent methyltransferase
MVGTGADMDLKTAASAHPDNETGPVYWERRYAPDHYIFGQDPSPFLVRYAPLLPPRGKVFLPADGEGRNGVYLAGLGHQVSAVDVSQNGINKARRLAQQNGVTVDYRVSDLRDHDWPVAAFAGVVAILIQFAEPEIRAILFQSMKRAVRKDGLILLHGFEARQAHYGTGGPPFPENLYTEQLLRDSFADCEILALESYDVDFPCSDGVLRKRAMIDLVARRT